MEVRVRQGKEKQVEARARFHRIVCDQPFEKNGSDTGMTPPEMLLAALGSCAMYQAARYLETRNLPPSAVELKLSADESGAPPFLKEISIDVDAPGLAPRTREGLLRAIQSCVLSRTLADGANVNVRLTTVVGESHSAGPVWR
jgi:uncharacterized OsmC-like protein